MTTELTVYGVARIVRDGELKYTNSGFPICQFSIVYNKKQKHGEEWKDQAHFFDAVMLGKLAENVTKKIVKGAEAYIEGELQQDTWESDGQKHSKVKILVNKIVVFGRESGGDDIPF